MRPALPLFLSLLVAACQPMPPVPPRASADSAATPSRLEVAEAGITELQAKLDRGDLDSRSLTHAYLARIEAIDKAGPKLNAVITINPEALAEADARDTERRAGHVRGPLHGIPVLIKDNIDARPMATTAGSLALADNIPAVDSFIVQRLRAAGAVILGKTNLSEWANFRSSHSISGWSAVGGQTNNPYVLDRNPCGSSSGTGTAIAASLATVGLGTETDGSIACPSAVAGLVGIKPTVGLVSRTGIVPIAASQDTAGPMARSVEDAAIVLTAIAGFDARDTATTDADTHRIDYRTHLKADALRGARIGILRKSMGFHPDTDAVTEAAVVVLREAGATVVDAEIPTAGQWGEVEFEVLLYEFKHGLNQYLASHTSTISSLVELIAFNEQHAAQEMPWFGQDLLEQSDAKGPLTEPDYLAARQSARELAGPQGIDAALAAQQLDALIAPATAPAWPTDMVLGDHFLGSGYGAAAVAGYPSITVPMGDSHGLPLGLIFMGAAWSEARLIELAYAYEQASQARRAPRYLSTLGASGYPERP